MVAYTDFSADPNSVPKINGLPGIIDNIQKGYMLAQLPEQVRNERAKQRLDNQYKQAQIDNLNNPGSQFTGDMANAYNLERLHQQTQQDPSLEPYYNTTKQQYDADLQQKRDLAAWRLKLSETAPYRGATNLGKLELERQEIESGYLPHSNGKTRLTPEQQRNMLNKNELMIYKITGDPKTREKIGYSTNLDTTLGKINPDKLTQYSGFFGGLQKQVNKVLSNFDLESQNYDDYTTNVTDAALAAKQLRQFLGDSIQPAAAEKLDALTNPETWSKNPKQAKAQLQEFLNTYKQEAQTYRRMANDPSIYYGQGEEQGNEYYPADQAPAPQDLSTYSDEELQRIAMGGG
jgi:hypothetical protein